MAELPQIARAAAWAALLLAASAACGCSSARREISFDAQNPSVRVSRHGILFGDEVVRPQDVAEILDDCDVPRGRTIHIRLDPDVRDLRPARALMACLCRAGYRNPVLVTERHAESRNLGRAEKGRRPAPARR